ncbi:MAG: DUF177 domain-containing protein [Krumholzibacteria bacterium]|nr:DUF177 domain-containing protein [Candidatus Krumholzibacteria bacterium]
MKLDLERQEHGRSELPIEGDLDLGLGDGRPERATLRGTILVDNVESRFLLGGILTAAGRAECGRCLGAFDFLWDVPLEIVVLRDVDTDEGEGDSLVIRQATGEVDLTDALRESAVLAFPLAPVCRPDCRGLCPRCGIDRNTGTCDCADEDIDPRWEGLP